MTDVAGGLLRSSRGTPPGAAEVAVLHDLLRRVLADLDAMIADPGELASDR